MTLANKITILRIILIPVFVISLIQRNFYLSAVIFTFSIATDALDGFIARFRNEKSKLGAFLDPIADKLLMTSSFLTLSIMKIIPLWVFIVIISRDLLIVLGWVIIYITTHSTEVKPRLLGKITTIFQMITVWFILLGTPYYITDNLIIATAIITSLSGLDYTITGSKKL